MGDTNSQPEMRLEMLSRPRLLAAARSMVGTVAQRMGFNEVQCGQISLAVDEAICNIINHGYDRNPDGRIWVSVWPLSDARPGIRIVMEDEARQVDPETIKSRNLDDVRPGGLGVHIIREAMDEVTYEKRAGRGMRLTVVKLLTETDSETDDASVATANEGSEGA
jgi:anti-sigma regulatory factor (Ser/Thr protein kinase)